MKTKAAAAIAVGLATCSFSLTSFASGTESSIVAANNEIGIAATGSLLNYQEHLPSPSDTVTGLTPGFAVIASGMNSKIISNLYIGLEYQYNNGSTTYHGALLAVPPKPITDSAPSVTQQLTVRVGKGFSIGSNLMVTPYVAYRWYHWNRSSGDNQEIYTQNSFGLGTMAQYSVNSRTVISANIAWLYGIGSSMHKPGPGIAGTGYPDFIVYSPPGQNFKLGNRATIKVGLKADYALTPAWHIFGTVSYLHTNFTESPYNQAYLVDTSTGKSVPLPIEDGFLEPGSSTNLFDFGVGIAYSF